MATTLRSWYGLLVALVLGLLWFSGCAKALSTTQVQGLLRLQSVLEHPSVTANWTYATDFCNLPSAPALNISCIGDTLTHLRIVGDMIDLSITEKLELNSLGANRSLSAAYSANTFANTLLMFPDLRILELISVGLWGTLPGKLDRIANLQVLNVSSNLISGSVPRSLGNLAGLRVLAMDNNVLSGSFPYWLSTVQTLETLSLSNNQISGGVNDTISYFWNLQTLSLDHNLLSGSLPSSISSLQNLNFLSLSYNQFTSSIPNLDSLANLQTLRVDGNSFGPSFPLLGSQLVSLHMSHNKLSGPIPPYLESFSMLKSLDLSSNALTGIPPLSVFALPSIASVSLSHNRLSGTLPYNLFMSKSLFFLDVSSNFFSGKLPLAFLHPKGLTVNFQDNCLSTKVQRQETSGFCTASATKLGLTSDSHESHRITIIAVSIGGGLGLLLAIAVLFLLLFRRFKSDKDSTVGPNDVASLAGSIGIPSELLLNARYISQSKRLGVLPPRQNRVFTLEEVKKATNNFSAATLVGEGSLGKVYKGQLEDGTDVAVKWVVVKSQEDLDGFKTQIDVLSKLRHRHLVSLLGYCTSEFLQEGEQENDKLKNLFIVSDFLKGGTLRSLLAKRDGKNNLSWYQRLAAVIGASRAIHYLHTGVVPPIFDNNLKTTSILLDENMEAQVSDFGLPDQPSPSAIDTTVLTKSADGLIADGSLPRRKEYRDRKDVYDFGLILLEIVLGRQPTMKNPFPQKRSELERLTKERGPSMELIDKSIVGMCGAESLATVLEIAGKCMLDDPEKRPSMEDVLWNLQYAAQVQEKSLGDLQDESDLMGGGRRDQLPKTPGPAERRHGQMEERRVSQEDWKASPTAFVTEFLR